MYESPLDTICTVLLFLEVTVNLTDYKCLSHFSLSHKRLLAIPSVWNKYESMCVCVGGGVEGYVMV